MRTLRWIGSLLACTALVVLGSGGAAVAQPRDSRPAELPNGPAKPGFDISRFSSAGNGWFETFYVEKTEPLRAALADGRVADDTRLLVTETADGKLAFVGDQMAYHHLAQGRAKGKDWLVTF